MLISINENFNTSFELKEYTDQNSSEAKKHCIIKFGINIILEKDEVMRSRFIGISGLHLIYPTIKENYLKRIRKKIPKQHTTVEIIKDGTLLKEGETTFENEITEIVISITIDEELCAFVDKAKSIKGMLSIQLTDGTYIRNGLTIKHSASDPKTEISSLSLNITSWILGFSISIWTVWLLYRWATDHNQVYNALALNIPLITSLCAAFFAYFGLPNIKSFSTFSPNIRKLKAIIHYPEFYFDQYIVKIFRSWFCIFIVLIISIAVYLSTERYKTNTLNIRDLGTVYALGPKQYKPAVISDNTTCAMQVNPTNDGSKTSDGYFAGIMHNISNVYNQAKQIIYSKLENLRLSPKGNNIPVKIYSRDIKNTCVYFRETLHRWSEKEESQKPYIRCVAELDRTGSQITAKPVRYAIGGISDTEIAFYPVAIEKPNNDINLSSQEGKAFITQELIRGTQNYINRWKMAYWFDSEDNCKPTIAVQKAGGDMKPYLIFLDTQIRKNEEHINNFNIARKIHNMKHDYIGSLHKIKEAANIKPVFDKFIAPEETIQTSTLFEEIAGKLVKLEYRFVDKKSISIPISDENKKKLSKAYVVSYSNWQHRDVLLKPIAQIGYVLHHFNNLRKTKGWDIDSDRDDLKNAIKDFLQKYYPPTNCNEYKFINVPDGNICNNSHYILADVTLLLLMIEKEFFKKGDLHDIILEHLIRGIYDHDSKSYLLMTVALDLIDTNRKKYFRKFFEDNNTELYGCTYKSIATWQKTQSDQTSEVLPIYLDSRDVDKHFKNC